MHCDILRTNRCKEYELQFELRVVLEDLDGNLC